MAEEICKGRLRLDIRYTLWEAAAGSLSSLNWMKRLLLLEDDYY